MVSLARYSCCPAVRPHGLGNTMRDTTRYTTTATDETHSNNLDASNDQDESNGDDTIKLVRTPPPRLRNVPRSVPVRPSSGKNIFFGTVSQSSPRHSRTEEEKWETTRRGRVERDSGRPADPLLPLGPCCYYYYYVPECYVHTYRLTRSCQSGTSPITGGTA